VEGFKDSDLLKIEVWRAASGKPTRYPQDDFITAIATDSPDQLSVPTQLPVLDLNDPDAVVDWLISQGSRFDYHFENHA
jgi:molybdopterin-guanine dinucleotide biosynthesis protein B